MVPVGSADEAKAKCDAQPGCTEFLYYAGMAYLNRGNAIKSSSKSSYRVNTTLTLPGAGIDQTITANYNARYVRIRPSVSLGDGYLSISQIIVNDADGNNISLGKQTYATSIYPGNAPVSSIVSGRTTPGPSSSPATGNRDSEFFEIDLELPQNISTIRILGGSDCCFPGNVYNYVRDRQTGLRIDLSQTSAAPVGAYKANDIKNTLVANNPTQRFKINAKRRYVRVLPSPLSGGWNGISQVVILDENGNNIAQGRSTYSPSTAGGAPERAIDADTSTIVNSSYTNRVWGNPAPMWLSNENINGYWELDLGDIVVISSITIYYRGDDPDRMKGISVVASNSSADSGGTLNWWKYYGSLPGQGQFILMSPSIDQTITVNYSARYVRIRPSLFTWAGDGLLSISSIIVIDQVGNNISLGKPTYATSIYPGALPVSIIVNGKTSPSAGTTVATGNRSSEFFEIDLGSLVNISTIRILGGSDCCFPGNQYNYVNDRQTGLRIVLSTTTTAAAAAEYAKAVVYNVVTTAPVGPVQSPPLPSTTLNFTPPPIVATPASSGLFWDLLNKVDQQDPTTVSNLAKVSEPDPNDLMQVSFSKYISIYAMSQTADLSGARLALLNNYDNLQTGLSTNVYTRPPAGSDPKTRSCANLNTARDNFNVQYRQIIASMKDLSGSVGKAGFMRDENLAYQNANLNACKGANPPAACISLASQETPVFSLLSKYDNVNNVMVSSGFVDISNNIDTINTAYTMLGCGKTPILFSPNQTDVIDTQTLISKLNQMSPYYLSPDTLQYITTSIISSSDTDASLMTDADKLTNISNVIQNIKRMTGTS
jgi:hypothetical protein